MTDAEAALEALKKDLVDQQKEVAPVAVAAPVVAAPQAPAAVAQIPEPIVKIDDAPPLAPTSQEVPSLSASQDLAPLFDATNEMNVTEPVSKPTAQQSAAVASMTKQFQKS